MKKKRQGCYPSPRAPPFETLSGVFLSEKLRIALTRAEGGCVDHRDALPVHESEQHVQPEFGAIKSSCSCEIECLYLSLSFYVSVY